MRPLFDLLSPGGSNGRLSTLIFHRVLDEVDPLFPDEVDARRFDEMCGWVNDWFNVLPLDEAISRLRAGTLPRRALAITFDDGYEDNHRLALPILQRHGLSATFFVATRFLDGGCMWNDRIIEAVRSAPGPVLAVPAVSGLDAVQLPIGDTAQRRAAIDTLIKRIKYLTLGPRDEAVAAVAHAARVAPPTRLMMRSDQVHDLARQGMGVGGHTESHPILASLDDDAARQEIERGKQRLESIVQQPVALFAYPNGKPQTDYTRTTVDLARRAGFDAAVSTAWGAARLQSDSFQLPRFTPWDRTRSRFALRLLANLRREPVFA